MFYFSPFSSIKIVIVFLGGVVGVVVVVYTKLYAITLFKRLLNIEWQKKKKRQQQNSEKKC